MADSLESGTDQASIRPVSSLRSLFENNAGSKPNPATPSSLLISRFQPQQGKSREDVPSITRASLDLPRRPSAWSTSEATSVSQPLGTPGPPVPRPRRMNPRPLQRPLSTTSLSVAQSPPTLRVDSPRSPCRLQQSIGTEQSLLLSYSTPATPFETISDPPLRNPLPSNTSSRLPTSESRLSLIEIRDGIQETKASSRIIAQAEPPKSLPPVVNRADKPKIPIKPQSIAGKSKLEPTGPVIDERVSPFSTPPSSDESGGPEGPRTRGTVQYDTTQSEKHIKGGDPILSEVTSKPRHDSQKDSINSDPWNGHGAEAQRLRSARVADVNHMVSEEPPGLPPRRAQVKQEAIQQYDSELNRRHSKRTAATSIAPISDTTKSLSTSNKPLQEFLPPPKRMPTTKAPRPLESHGAAFQSRAGGSTESGVSFSKYMDSQDLGAASQSSPAADYPDCSSTNRRPPYCKIGADDLDAGYDTRNADLCGQYIATIGHLTKVWNLMTGELVLSVGQGDREIRTTSLAFRPEVTANQEGSVLWLGTNYGDIQELDIASQMIVETRSGAHERREILKIHRQQSCMWTLDDGGRLCVWPGDDRGLPNLQGIPRVHRVSKGHTYSIVIQDTLWLAAGKDLYVYRPNTENDSNFAVFEDSLSQPGVGTITSGAIIAGEFDRVYFGHADGKITIYSTTNYQRLNMISISSYKITSLAGAGSYLWAGYNTGTMSVYNTRSRPWTVTKEWVAHSGPILGIVADRSSLWKDGVLRVISLGADHAMRFWDGTLEDDWLENDLREHDIEYCSFRELSAFVLTWNAGAATPTHLRQEDRDSQLFEQILRSSPADLLVFGFQELVDLEDPKLTAKTFFKGNKKKDPSEQEHMSHQYRAWRDYLVRCVEETMPSNEPYHLLHTASMVGLFSCVFIKVSLRNRIRNVNSAELKRGMGGLHGNKGALVLRFVLDDSSICLANCHLAAGQTQTVNRNNDITAILEASILPTDGNSSARSGIYVGGGDGSMILDNEICILNGDLNYRIDTMGRDTVVKAINANNLSRLLERDQLLVSKRRNPGFRARAFQECPITFAPTYKYDVWSDRYDTSEKRRAPAWCDRILYRGAGNIKQIDYRRHELRISDHRPVSGIFKMRIKTIAADERAAARKESEQRFQKAKEQLAKEAKILYLRDILGVPPNEAKRLI